jgi:hypothetical protein
MVLSVNACLRQQSSLCIIPIGGERLMTANLLDDLAEYVNVLSTSMERTRRAEDRSPYLRHLAAAALIFQRLQQSNLPEAREQVVTEQQAYGRSFLDGEEGKAAEAAFSRFATSFAQKG